MQYFVTLIVPSRLTSTWRWICFHVSHSNSPHTQIPALFTSPYNPEKENIWILITWKLDFICHTSTLKYKIFWLSWLKNLNELFLSLDIYISLLCKYGCLVTIQDISIIFHHHWYIYSITIIPSPMNTFRRKVCVMVNWTLRNEYHIDILFTILCVYNVEFPTA